MADLIRWLCAWLFGRGWVRTAQAFSLLTPPPTDRGHLLLAPTAGDRCDAFVQRRSPAPDVPADCATDGHYLCCECARRSETWRADRGLEGDPTRTNGAYPTPTTPTEGT